MKCPYVIKVCTKCKRILVANTMNFKRNRGCKWNLNSECKRCSCKRQAIDRRIKNNLKKKILFDDIDENKVWNHCPFCIKICTTCKRILVSNENNFHKDKKGKHGLSSQCKSCFSKKTRIYRESNQDKIKESSKEYYKNNKEKLLEQKKEYYKNNPHIRFNNCITYRNKKESGGSGISKEQWFEMMEFFEWKCAYSGEYIGGNNENKKRTIDHIIPLSKEGLNEIWNCVPMLKSLNSSKYASDMVDWYKQQEFFDINRLMKIYEWQEYAFEKWGMDI